MSRHPIDFRTLRELVSPGRVLRHHRWPVHPQGYGEPHGPCLDERCSSRRSRVLTWNHQVAYCHRCERTWDALAIWMHLHQLPAYEAALQMCYELDIQIPYYDPFARR